MQPVEMGPVKIGGDGGDEKVMEMMIVMEMGACRE